MPCNPADHAFVKASIIIAFLLTAAIILAQSLTSASSIQQGTRSISLDSPAFCHTCSSRYAGSASESICSARLQRTSYAVPSVCISAILSDHCLQTWSPSADQQCHASSHHCQVQACRMFCTSFHKSCCQLPQHSFIQKIPSSTTWNYLQQVAVPHGTLR